MKNESDTWHGNMCYNLKDKEFSYILFSFVPVLILMLNYFKHKSVVTELMNNADKLTTPKSSIKKGPY